MQPAVVDFAPCQQNHRLTISRAEITELSKEPLFSNPWTASLSQDASSLPYNAVIKNVF